MDTRHRSSQHGGSSVVEFTSHSITTQNRISRSHVQGHRLPAGDTFYLPCNRPSAFPDHYVIAVMNSSMITGSVKHISQRNHYKSCHYRNGRRLQIQCRLHPASDCSTDSLITYWLRLIYKIDCQLDSRTLMEQETWNRRLETFSCTDMGGILCLKYTVYFLYRPLRFSRVHLKIPVYWWGFDFCVRLDL